MRTSAYAVTETSMSSTLTGSKPVFSSAVNGPDTYSAASTVTASPLKVSSNVADG